MSPKFNFIGLPAEIRLSIYKELIQDVYIVLDHDKIDTRKILNERWFLPIHIREMINFVKPDDVYKIALLQASPFCHEDAMDVLAANSTIEVPSEGPDHDKRNNILALVDPFFLRHVTAVHMSPDAFLGFNHIFLPRLERVHLSARLDTQQYRVSHTIHDLACPRCGDYQGKYYQDYFWMVSQDGRWKKNKLRRLAIDMDWEMDFTLVIDRFTCDSSASVRIELCYDLVMRCLIGRCVVRNGRVELRDEQFSDLDLLADLRYYL